MNRVLSAILDVLFPPRCPFCDRVLARPDDRACQRCAKEPVAPLPLDFSVDEKFFDACAAAYSYGGRARGAVIRFKFNGQRDLAVPLGAAVADAVRNAGIAADIVTWPPLGAKRMKTRGYNQAELLARAAAKILAIPANDTLIRTRETDANSSLDGADARRSNVAGAFAAVSPEIFRGKRVLLIDDVVTTGATLNECARTLRMAGAESVSCAAAAMAVREQCH